MFKNFSQKNQLGGGQLHPLYASDNKLFQKEIITFFSNALWIHLRTVCGPPLSLMYVPLSQGGQKIFDWNFETYKRGINQIIWVVQYSFCELLLSFNQKSFW